jgi:hypothetical protein
METVKLRVKTTPHPIKRSIGKRVGYLVSAAVTMVSAVVTIVSAAVTMVSAAVTMVSAAVTAATAAEEDEAGSDRPCFNLLFFSPVLGWYLYQLGDGFLIFFHVRFFFLPYMIRLFYLERS